MNKGEKIVKIIGKFKHLEKAKEAYSKVIRHFSFWEIDSENSLWSKKVQSFVDKIEIDLIELWDCILENTQWSKEGIEGAIRTKEPDPRGRLIHEFNLILRRIEFESQQERKIKLANKPKTKKRATKAEMANRNKTVTIAAAQFKSKHDRLPTVDEIVYKTNYSRQQVYGTPAYKEGKIAKNSAYATSNLPGSSVQRSICYNHTSEEHSRAYRRSKADQNELDAMIDEQEEDDRSNFVK
ncbi:MAG: hypothetical protein GY845_20545 [Planctomycetes bacterium]|nr:hypothetical protein [Planctomycetota bacterium]